MSEQRRATLTPFGKSDKKSNKSQRKTFRLRFTLSDPNENSCPVFDYAATVKSEERKILKKHREEKDKKPNGFVDPFEDDDEDVKRLARKFETKYGDKKKLKSYAELGAGYDETDPFIDNTDANDEALGEDQETARGGYYINSGPLELRQVETNLSDHSDSEAKRHGPRKRSLPVIDEDEEDEEEKEEEALEQKEEEECEVEGESKPVDGAVPAEPEKIKLEEGIEAEAAVMDVTPDCNGLDSRKKKKKKKRKRHDDDDDANGSFVKTKKSKTVKALLEEKRVSEQPLKTSEEPKRQVASETSIAEAIESVVNNIAGGHHGENSNSSNSLHSVGDAVVSSMSEDSTDGKPGDNSPPPLPEGLAPEVMTLVNTVKQTAAVTDNTRKTFCPDINNCLIKLEWKTRELAASSRNMLFAHLAHHLPCTKDTLMRRAKKLFITREESHVETVICKLKATIDATMPTLLEEYGRECQRIAEEKGVAEGGEENQPAVSPAGASLPRRRFPWTDETRGYLLSIVRAKQKCHRVAKPRKSSWEEFVHAFLHSKIRPLWPNGWMKTSVLVKEINRSPSSIKVKHGGNKSDSRLNASSTSSNGSPLAAKASADHQQTTTTGHHQQPTTTGHHSQSSTTGHHQQPTTIGHHQQPTITDHHQQPTTTGHHQQPTTTGHHQQTTTTGHHQQPITTGHHQTITGHHHQSSTTGHHNQSSTTGHHNQSSTTSHHNQSSTTGHHNHSSTTGHHNHSSTTGHHNQSSTTGHHHQSSTTDHHQQPTATSHHQTITSHHHQSSTTSHHHQSSTTDHHHQPTSHQQPETFSMDCLLKRTGDGACTPDYNTTLSDLIKKEGVIMNGASLPLKNVNSSQKNDSRSEKILDLSSCNSSVSVSVCGTSSVIQSVSSERTTAQSSGVSDTTGLMESAADKSHGSKEAMSNVPLNRKQRLLQVSSQTNWHSETLDVSVIKKTDCMMRSQTAAVEKGSGRCAEVDKETTTATDILSQIISESLRSPPYNNPPAKSKEEVKSQGHKDQELLYDVMQEIKELNHLSSSSSGRDSKNNSFTGASWSYPVKSMDSSKSTPYHNEFLNYISGNSGKETSVASSTPTSLPTPTPTPYSHHNTSPYENLSYVNEVNKSMYTHSPHRSTQSFTAHSSTPSSKVTQMKNLPNTGISSGLPHRYMGQMDYSADDNHLMGLASSLQYSLTNWPYPGSESQPHQ